MTRGPWRRTFRFGKHLILSGAALFAAAWLLAGVLVQADGPKKPAGSSSARAQPRTMRKADFRRDVAPIFEASCNSCHNAQRADAKLRLDSERAAVKGGVSGPAIVPGSSKESLLVKRLLDADHGPRMPLGGDPLSPAQVKKIRAWIEQLPAAPASVATAQDYATKIQPILDAHCVSCHGPLIQQRQLRLDTWSLALKGSASGKVIIAGSSQDSPLVRRLVGHDQPQMPFNAPPLPKDQIALIRAWIDGGVPGADIAAGGEKKVAKHWAYVKPQRPEIPKVNHAAWVRNPIDNFVLASLEKEGLGPSPEASKETQIRRVTLDLIGLPPTPLEMDAFLADKSPDAYEKVVDRLLASPHYGERWARPWLDLARYGDSHGYEKDGLRVAWKWRDWVINALNADMSFKEFTIQQIAGDMLPKPSTDQRVATGFHRNTLLNQEGGVDDEEARFYILIDRVNTTASVWLGLTLECAQCHDHKYDPFSQKDYYRMFAFFDHAEYSISDLGQGEGWVVEPEIELPSPQQAEKGKQLGGEIQKQKSVLNTATPELAAAGAKWEEEMKRADADWTLLRPSHAVSQGGATLTVLDDQSILAGGKNPEADTYSLQAQTQLTGITGLRLEVLNDPSLPNAGPGRDSEGNFFLSALEVEAAPMGKEDAKEKITFKEAFADESQRDYDVKNVVKKAMYSTGWAIDATPTGAPLRRQAVFVPDKPFGFSPGTVLTIRLKHEMRRASRNLGRFRLSVASIAEPAVIVSVPARLRPVLDVPAAQRSDEQKEKVAALFRSVSPLLKPTRDRIAELEKDLEKLAIPTAMILRERHDFERPATDLHLRGAYLSKGERVYANVPAGLNPLPENQMPNRLGLANWLVDEDNPLTARVTVNRFWEHVFGRGIVETSENFGMQGARPSHPELLDWLATEFGRQDWSMKKLVRLIVTSATYRQSSRLTQELVERDPYNRLLARGPRFRIEGEMVRDLALTASGLLSHKIGGPSVFPYQPDGVWDQPYSDDKWVLSGGEDRYRRALYVFVRRTAPYPSMTTFDAPSREFCTVRRVRTNTPLQALTTLNDPAFFEAARAMGKRIMTEATPDAAARATHGFRLAVGRRPTPEELGVLASYFDQQLQRFRGDEKSARAVVQAGENPPPNLTELAAWTMVANVLLNMDETVTKE